MSSLWKPFVYIPTISSGIKFILICMPFLLHLKMTLERSKLYAFFCLPSITKQEAH